MLRLQVRVGMIDFHPWAEEASGSENGSKCGVSVYYPQMGRWESELEPLLLNL